MYAAVSARQGTVEQDATAQKSQADEGSMNNQAKLERIIELWNAGEDIDTIVEMTGSTKGTVRQQLLNLGESISPVPRSKRYVAEFTRQWNRVTSRLK